MKTLFKWLCRTCFCIVLAAIPIGIFVLVVLGPPKATFLGCSVGGIAEIGCGRGALGRILEIVLTLPFGFVMAPLFLIHPSFILNDILVPPSMSPWMKYTHPLVVYLYTLNLVLALAVIQIFWTIGRFIAGKRRHRS